MFGKIEREVQGLASMATAAAECEKSLAEQGLKRFLQGKETFLPDP
jgi:hypothetical protein